MKKNKFILFFICIFACLHICTFLSAQQNKIDSLSVLLKYDKEDTNKINHLNSLAFEFRNNNPDTAIYFAKAALALSEKNKFQKGIAESNLWLGTATTNLGKYTESLTFLSTALSVSQAINDQSLISMSFNNIGNVYNNQGNYPEALTNYFSSLKIKEVLGSKKGIAASYNNIGSVYDAQKNYPEALKNYFASLKIKEAIGDKRGIAYTYGSIGNVYEDEYDYPEALKNYFVSLKIMEELDDQPGIARSYNNIGIIYFDQGRKFEEAGDKDSAEIKYSAAFQNYSSSLKIKEALGEKVGIAISYCNLGLIATKQKQFKTANDYFIKSRDLSVEIGYKDNLKDVYLGIAELDSATGDFKSAFENHKLYIVYRDSLDNEETRKKTIQSQMSFDFEKKEAVEAAEHKKELENQRAIADEKNHKQKIVLLLVSCFGLLVLFFAGFIFRSLRVTRKQKLEIENQKNLVEEKQKEILDSIHYAKRIQQSLLPTEKYIDRSLNKLKKR